MPVDNLGTAVGVALKSDRAAWSHILYPVKSETAGKPFDLEHSLISSRDRAAIPIVVYDFGDRRMRPIIRPYRFERVRKPLGAELLKGDPVGVCLVAPIAAYVYLPKVRDKVVLEGSIRDAVAKLDPQFGYTDGFDEATGKYHKLIWAKNPPEFASPTAMIVREAEARKQLNEEGVPVSRPEPGSSPGSAPHPGSPDPSVTGPSTPGKPRRFYGSVEIDMVRPVKSSTQSSTPW